MVIAGVADSVMSAQVEMAGREDEDEDDDGRNGQPTPIRPFANVCHVLLQRLDQGPRRLPLQTAPEPDMNARIMGQGTLESADSGAI